MYRTEPNTTFSLYRAHIDIVYIGYRRWNSTVSDYSERPTKQQSFYLQISAKYPLTLKIIFIITEYVPYLFYKMSNDPNFRNWFDTLVFNALFLWHSVYEFEPNFNDERKWNKDLICWELFRKIWKFERFRTMSGRHHFLKVYCGNCQYVPCQSVPDILRSQHTLLREKRIHLLKWGQESICREFDFQTKVKGKLMINKIVGRNILKWFIEFSSS